jgi:tRNA uridine 5-carboxymethylaminomethyl modification enzyme
MYEDGKVEQCRNRRQVSAVNADPILPSCLSSDLQYCKKPVSPHIGIEDITPYLPQLVEGLTDFDEETISLAEVNIKYRGYIEREQEMVDKMNRLEELALHDSLDYSKINSLSIESREKLTRLRPRTLGQASRISGVSPSDISVLLVHMGR